MDDKICVIIADDHPVVRQGLRQIIEREVDLEVLTEAGDGEAALESIVRLRPDVAVLDIDMPRMNGFDVLRALREKQTSGRVILLTVHREEEFFDEALRLGANGYVLKDSAVEDIVAAIRAVADGQNYVSPALTAYLFGQRQGQSNAAPSGLEHLTATEKQILKLIAEYQTNNQIAERLFISPLTVKTHRRNISLKLQLEGNHALMKYALEHKARL